MSFYLGYNIHVGIEPCKKVPEENRVVLAQKHMLNWSFCRTKASEPDAMQ